MTYPRRITQIAAAATFTNANGENDSVLYALADDGTLWGYVDGSQHPWWQLPPLPAPEGT